MLVRRRRRAHGRAQLGGARPRIGGDLGIVGLERTAGEALEGCGRRHRLRQMARAVLGTAPGGQEVLHDPVFERMERDHHQPAARREDALRGGQPLRELAELVVDVEAQRLERARRRMDVAGPAMHHAGDDVGERAGGRDRPFAARRDDGAGDGAGAALLAEEKDDVGEVALGGLRDHVGRRRTGGAHAHVERPVEPEREAAFRRVELHGRHADIEHDAVDRRDPEIAGNAVERSKFAADEGQAAGGLFDLGRWPAATAVGSRSMATTRVSPAARMAAVYPPAPKVPST